MLSPEPTPGSGCQGKSALSGGEHSTLSNDGRRDPMRNVRVSDELWEAAKEAVKERGDPSVSHILREALAQYVRATQRRRVDPTAPNRGANLERHRRGDPPQQRRASP